jgi:hypothetical protein
MNKVIKGLSAEKAREEFSVLITSPVTLSMDMKLKPGMRA